MHSVAFVYFNISICMVLIVYDENGNCLKFETWKELQDYFDELEKKKGGPDSVYRIIKSSEPLPVEFD